MRDVDLPAVGLTNIDHFDWGGLHSFHLSELAIAGMRSKDGVFGDVESFLIVAGGVVLGDVESFGGIPVAVNFRVAAANETNLGKDIADFLDGLGDKV